MVPRRESNARRPFTRGAGADGGFLRVQAVPSHSHVSFTAVAMSKVSLPPNNTTRLRTPSYAIAKPSVADGEVPGALACQVEPFHSNVPVPVNSTVRARCAS